MELKKALEILREHGWDLSRQKCSIDEWGNVTYTDYRDGTRWEINPHTGESRHCGNGAGCFFTEWEI